MIYAIIFLIGCIVGVLTLEVIRPIMGRLDIDERDPESVKMRIVITNDIDFSKTKNVVLKINNSADLSHK